MVVGIMSFNNVVLSMDLSLSAAGFAVLATEDRDGARAPIVLESSLITTRGTDHGARIAQIIDEVERLINEYEPEHLVREKSFSRFAAATQAIYKVNGAVDYILTPRVIDEISNSTAKKFVAGNGRAPKDEVAAGAFRMLSIDNVDEYYRINRKGEAVLLDDKTDALAVGLTYYNEKGIVKA